MDKNGLCDPYFEAYLILWFLFGWTLRGGRKFVPVIDFLLHSLRYWE